MKRIILLFALIVLTGSVGMAIEPTQQDSIDQVLTKFYKQAQHQRPHFFFRQNNRQLLELVPKASLTLRKKIYRWVVYELMPNFHTSWEYRRVGISSFFKYFDHDYSHFHKYLNKLSIGETQRFFKYYNYHNCKEHSYSYLPLDVARLKQDDLRLYMIARAQFNLLKAGRPLRKERYW